MQSERLRRDPTRPSASSLAHALAPLVLGLSLAPAPRALPQLGGPLERPGVAPRTAPVADTRAARLTAEFDAEAALDAAWFLDRYSRSPGSEGYRIVLGEVARALQEAGYGRLPGLELDLLEVPLDEPSWEGRSASLTLLGPDRSGAGAVVLHAFDSPWDVDRAMLPRFAPSADVTGPAVFDLEDVREGTVLVTRARVRPDLLRRAAARRAAAVVSASLATFNVDPSGDGHLAAIQVRELEPDPALPVLQISPASYAAVRASERPVLRLRATAVRGLPVAHALVARVRGTGTGGESVALVAHLQGAAASDDAGGAAGLLEAARTAARLVVSGREPRPRRSLELVFGPELLQGERWLATTPTRPVAAVAVLGIGTGDGSLVLERGPDPGCDAPEVLAGVPANALATIARCALMDAVDLVGDLRVAETPYEGGAAPDPFLAARVPAVLLWARPGVAARTSLDRFDEIDGEALRRGAVAALETAWSIAAPSSADLARFASSMELERAWRLEEGTSAIDWTRWFDEAATWLVETLH